MFVVRPAAVSDIAALEALSAADPDVHTFPKTGKAIESAIERSIASFGARPEVPVDEAYFFVLAATDEKSALGAAAISATAGANGSFFAFRNDVFSQVSRDLNISHNVHALTLCSGLTGWSQLSGLAMLDRQAEPQAALLSRTRLLFAAVAPQRFCEKFFASMAGVVDAGGRSPFWEAIGRKFFQMDFLGAERMTGGARNRTMIVELMPHYPVYVPLLPEDAQAALGQVHTERELPFRILCEEGFAPDEYVDIFDGGPILQAHRNALRSFSHSMLRTVDGVAPGRGPKSAYLVATAREEQFRAVLVECEPPELSEGIALTGDAMRCLDVTRGDTVLCVKW